jgi:NAD dependent epimerase/dehydratase family enzyme
MADEALLASQRVLPARLLDHGFSFVYPTLDAALARALER